MSLLEQQNFLARLYTDENLRRAFLREPEKIGRENNLDANEIEELSGIIPEELNFFAESLVWKRFGEVKKFLPLTSKALDKDFKNHFIAFSNQFQPATIKKHLEDAIEFCSFLQNAEIKPIWVQDLAKFERERLIFNAGLKRFVFCRLDFDVREIINEVSRHNAEAPAEMEFSKRKTYVVWFRIGARVKHFVF